MIILFTDGENNSGLSHSQASYIANIAKGKNLYLNLVVIGSNVEHYHCDLFNLRKLIEISSEYIGDIKTVQSDLLTTTFDNLAQPSANKINITVQTP